MKSGTNNWDHLLFVQNGNVYLPILYSLRDNARKEVKGLFNIFNDLKVKEGARILDLYCGIGRHAISLATYGFNVVGYDPSPVFLNEASKIANLESSQSNNLKFYLGPPDNVSTILLENGETDFNVVIMMDNCLGYRTDDHDVQILKDILLITAENCLLIMQTENRDWRIRNFEKQVSHCFNDSEIHELWQFDLESSCAYSDSNFYRKTKDGTLSSVLRLQTKLRLYSLHELKYLITKSGWKYLRNYDDFETLRPATLHSENIVTVSTNT